MFKNLFDSLLANVNARLDSVIGQVAEIKARLDIYEKDTSDLKVSLEFSHIINLSIQHGIVPDEMKIARVIPIFKFDDQSLFTNYQPISVLPSF